MRLFFLTHSVIGSVYDQILILTNRQVVLMGLKYLQSLPEFIGLSWGSSYKLSFLPEILRISHSLTTLSVDAVARSHSHFLLNSQWVTFDLCSLCDHTFKINQQKCIFPIKTYWYTYDVEEVSGQDFYTCETTL